ncbi:hypothetical protein [Tenacibaculum finnmarkense]|uniref:hypothetical protein n=1 Tax=Tenacibaculum finnmarkense TaxID=2781243 RepID=UPI001EFA479B|nr:hypothetical protein [Tenacibaculum finnmarkense]
MNKFQKNLTSLEVVVILLLFYAVNFNIFNERNFLVTDKFHLSFFVEMLESN